MILDFFVMVTRKMLRIGICDENTQDREAIRKIVTQVLFNEEFSCVEYADAETMEQELDRETVPFDLLLLEIMFESKNGLQLARKIRQKKLDVDLIFVTEETEYVYEGYDVRAIGYVRKKNMHIELPVCLQRYMAGYRQGDALTVKSESAYRTGKPEILPAGAGIVLPGTGKSIPKTKCRSDGDTQCGIAYGR